MTSSKSLDELGIRIETDKSSLRNDYLRKYERLFKEFRNSPITFLEIGIAEGASLHLWEQYFPKATIVGVDIREACRKFEGGRRRVEIASQADPQLMGELGRKYAPNIIIDDGSHEADHILISFQSLFPHLGPGGLYVAEDLTMHAGPNASRKRGTAEMSPQEYFARLGKAVCGSDPDPLFERGLSSAAESVEFFRGAAVIRKAPLPDPDFLSTQRAIVKEMNSHLSWGWFATLLARTGGHDDEAVQCAKRAIEMAPDYVAHHAQFVSVLERAGRNEDAMAAARAAAVRWPKHYFFPNAIARLEKRRQ